EPKEKREDYVRPSPRVPAGLATPAESGAAHPTESENGEFSPSSGRASPGDGRVPFLRDAIRLPCWLPKSAVSAGVTRPPRRRRSCSRTARPAASVDLPRSWPTFLYRNP